MNLANHAVELWHHYRRQHYPDMFCAIRAMRIGRMYGHLGRVENCTICGDWTYSDRRKK